MVLSAVFGLSMMIALPLFEAPDEPVHFYRAYQVGEGKVIGETYNNVSGGYVRPAVEGNYDAGPEELPETFIPFPSSVIYSPLGYLPQAAGIDLGRLIDPSVRTMAYIGRLFNLATYIVLVSLAIKIAKKGKWVYAVVGLFPIAIQQAASLSTDVMSMGIAFIAIAYIHSLFYSKSIARRQIVILVLLAIGLGLTKQTNLIFLLPAIFIPTRLYGSWRSKLLLTSAIIIAGIIAAVGWYGAVIASDINTDYASYLQLSDVKPVRQVKHMMNNPFEFLGTLFRSFVFEGFKSAATPDFYLVSAYGFFSWFTYKLPLPFIALGYSLLLLSLLHSKDNKEHKDTINNGLAIIQFATFLLSVLGIAVALYIVWTPVGSPQISGIQGRYFIPLIPLLIPICGWLGKFVSVKFAKELYLGFLVAAISTINLTAMLAITYRWFY